MTEDFQFSEESFTRRRLERSSFAESAEVAKITVSRMISAHPSHGFTAQQIEDQAVRANDLLALLIHHDRETAARFADEYEAIVFFLREEGDSKGRPWRDM